MSSFGCVGAAGAVLEYALTPDKAHLSLSWQGASGLYRLQKASGLSAPVTWDDVCANEGPLGHYQVNLRDERPGAIYRLMTPAKLHHVLIVGQSLAIGTASVVITTNQPGNNWMFNFQAYDGGYANTAAQVQDDLHSLVPLHERWVETIASGFANAISARVDLGTHDLLVSNCGRGATPYSGLQRLPSNAPEIAPTNTYPYLRGLEQIAAGKALLGSCGYEFSAVLALHGESDFLNPQYDANIRSWQADIESDVRRITGQTNRIPMFHSQSSSWGRAGVVGRIQSPFLTLEESQRNPEKTILVCPKYMLPYWLDGVHLTGQGYRWLGEYYAKAYYQQVIYGKPWIPLRPASVKRTGDTILITFDGVVGQLVFDPGLVPPPPALAGNVTGSPTGGFERVVVGQYGFEYWDEVGEGTDQWQCATTIRQVELAGPNQVRIVLNQPPLGAQRRIRYAYTPSQLIGPSYTDYVLQAHGCLRDADPTPSLYGNALYNWCVHFDLPCP